MLLQHLFYFTIASFSTERSEHWRASQNPSADHMQITCRLNALYELLMPQCHWFNTASLNKQVMMRLIRADGIVPALQASRRGKPSPRSRSGRSRSIWKKSHQQMFLIAVFAVRMSFCQPNNSHN